MAHDKFTVEHYKEKLDYYKNELECDILAEMSFEEFENEPEVLRKSDANSIIEYVIRDYNSVNISDYLSKYINVEYFIEALGTDKESFADKLRKMVMEEYHNQRDHWIEDLIKYINSSDSTLAEKETAKMLVEDCPSLLMYLNNAYNIWLDKKYDRGSVMRLITNPDKLKSFITENTALLDVLTKTILENIDSAENIKERSEDGLLVDATI